MYLSSSPSTWYLIFPPCVLTHLHLVFVVHNSYNTHFILFICIFSRLCTLELYVPTFFFFFFTMYLIYRCAIIISSVHAAHFHTNVRFVLITQPQPTAQQLSQYAVTRGYPSIRIFVDRTYTQYALCVWHQFIGLVKNGKQLALKFKIRKHTRV